MTSACSCLACISDVGVGFTNFIWACSEWGHQLQPGELEQLVPAAVDPIGAGWPEPGRGGALMLVEALTQQVGAMAWWQ